MVGFHQDEEGDWVAHLSCGHTQHVRHRPPFQERPWVVEEEGRRSRIGARLECPLCDRVEPPTTSWDADPGGGEAACYAPLVCPGCGAVVGPGGKHKPGCPGWEEP